MASSAPTCTSRFLRSQGLVDARMPPDAIAGSPGVGVSQGKGPRRLLPRRPAWPEVPPRTGLTVRDAQKTSGGELVGREIAFQLIRGKLHALLPVWRSEVSRRARRIPERQSGYRCLGPRARPLIPQEQRCARSVRVGDGEGGGAGKKKEITETQVESKNAGKRHHRTESDPMALKLRWAAASESAHGVGVRRRAGSRSRKVWSTNWTHARRICPPRCAGTGPVGRPTLDAGGPAFHVAAHKGRFHVCI